MVFDQDRGIGEIFQGSPFVVRLVNMKDIQNQRDSRQVDIRKVGVKDVSYPILVRDKSQVWQHTIATVNMYVHLPHHYKGTHMSRFVQILHECRGEIDYPRFMEILQQMRERLSAETSHLEIFFPYFLQRDTVTPSALPRRYQCGLSGSLAKEPSLCLSLEVPLYADYSSGFGEKRMGHVALRLCFAAFYWIEDCIECVESVLRDAVLLSPADQANALREQLEQVQEINSFSLTVYHQNEDVELFASVATEPTCSGGIFILS